MTTTSTGVTFLQAADLVAAHLAHHQLPEPASLTVIARARHSEVTVQVQSDTVARVAADLLAWANTLTTVAVEAWRPPHGDRVHLSIASTLTGPAGTVTLDVYGGADDDPAPFADLTPGENRTVSLGHLRSWSTSGPATPDGGAAA